MHSERKDKIEDGNRVLIQKFQSQLTQQLEILHKTVAASMTQQEQQLKDMEEDMQSFVSTKAEVRYKHDASWTSLHTCLSFLQIYFVVCIKATEELRGRVGKLKTMYGSGIKALDDMAKELEENSRSTFGSLNSEVSKHSHAVEGVSIKYLLLLSDLNSFSLFLSLICLFVSVLPKNCFRSWCIIQWSSKQSSDAAGKAKCICATAA